MNEIRKPEETHYVLQIPFCDGLDAKCALASFLIE